MAIGFWNVERLGASTPDESKDLIAAAVEWFADHQDVGLFSFCEVTSNTRLSGPTQFHEIEKIGHVRRRYRTKAAAQLGYAFVAADPLDFDARPIDIPHWSTVFGQATYQKGGNVFATLSKRRVIRFDGLVDGTNVFIYHANSSAYASYLVTWVTEALRQLTTDNFVLIGDLNCTPPELETHWDYIDAHVLRGFRGLVKTCYWGYTHHARTGPSKTLDYAVASQALAVDVTSWNTLAFSAVPTRRDHPDHFPITVSIA